MDPKEKYKIRESVRDAIRILDSAPIKPDLMSEAVIVQLTNRVPIAHLAIERALKALIFEGGGAKKRTHSLDNLHKDLRKCNSDSARFLGEAFADAVDFFGLEVRAEGFDHFRSIQSYLSKVGGGQAFQTLRYWPIEDALDGESPIPFVWLPIHREVLCALSCLFSGEGKQTVSARVELEVASKVTEIREFSELQDDIFLEKSQSRYKDWLARNHGTFRHALKRAFRNDFVSESEDDYWSMNLRSAYEELKKSEDPAVQYFNGTFSYLPKGSQARDPCAIPQIEWLDDLHRKGFVETPAGYEIGYIERFADGAWGITPSEPGLVQVTAIAEDLKDAKHYLVNRLSNKIPFNVNGIQKQLRIVGEPRIAGNADWTSEIDFQEKATIVLEFWDNKHGLLLKDQVSFEFIPNRRTLKRLYEGSVTKVEGQSVTIVGTEVYT